MFTTPQVGRSCDIYYYNIAHGNFTEWKVNFSSVFFPLSTNYFLFHQYNFVDKTFKIEAYIFGYLAQAC